MTAGTELTVSTRDKVGKANRRLAAESKIPAVLYGPGREPVALALDRHDFELFASRHAAGSTLVDLRIEGQKQAISAMIREVQHSSVKGTVLHVDFLEVNVDKPVTASVTLHLLNDPEGVRAGGVLTISLHELNIEAKPGDLPETLDVDVSGLAMGDTLYVRDIPVPPGVTLLDDADAVVASVQAPRAEIEEAVTEEGAEPEVIGRGEAEGE
jgi:large subunit ribosomal protein L25